MASKKSESSVPASSNSTASSDLLSEAFDAMGVTVRQIRASIDHVTAELQTKYNTSKASHLAFLGEKLSGIMRELRLHEKHEAEQADRMTPEEELQGLLQFLDELSPEQRDAVRERLDVAEVRSNLLGHEAKETKGRN